MKYKLFGLLFASILLFPGTSLAQTPTEEVTRLDVAITIESNSQIKVSESILYNFGVEQRHGIYRTIPLRYKARGGNFNLRISDISVSLANNSVPFEKSREGNGIKLKIGDADKFITGEQAYTINYTVTRAINYFDDHDELYWNAIGTAWEVPVKSATATVTIPGDGTGSTTKCFTGIEGSTESECSTLSNGNTLSYAPNRSLEAGEGLTIVAGFPKGLVSQPTTTQQALWVVQDNFILGLPILIFLGMYYLWRKYGKDPKGTGNIVAQYEAPDNFTPLEVGTLVDYSAHKQDISAEIIYLATKGYIHINRIETQKLLVFKGADYELKKLKEAGTELTTADKTLFDALFKDGSVIKLSELSKNVEFGKKITEAKSETTKDLISQGYFPRNPHTLRTVFIIVGGAIAIWGSGVAVAIFGLYGGIAVFVSSIIIIIFGALMPMRTHKGVLAREHILGLKEYMNVAEKDRLKFHNAPEKNPQLFEKLLPFAIALGVDKAWSKQFEDIYKTNPSWYSDGTGHAFNAYLLSSSLGDFSSSLNSAVGSSTTTASSGGSGFSGGSGGGGGGGGGGSW